MMNEFLRRTWAEIDLDALTENYHAIRSQVNGKAARRACVLAVRAATFDVTVVPIFSPITSAIPR